MATPSDSEHLQAGLFLAAQGLYGLAWLGEDLVARKRIGVAEELVPLGEPVTDGVLALMGFDDKIRGLRRGQGRAVVVPNVQLDTRDLDAPRFNVSVYWNPGIGEYLLLLARVMSRSGIEEMFEAEARMRRMAEDELAVQRKLVERANEELRRANADLGAFASVISHDLRSPLRALRYFAEDAAAAVGAGNDAAAIEGMQKVVHQSRRMAGMLTGLLEYSRIGRKAEVAEELDTGELAREVAGATQRPDGFGIAVAGTWPVLTTLAQPLDIVLRNLVDNAVKHHDAAEGRIVVTGEEKGDVLVISVADDGPGIPPEWHEAIFLPFKRMADSDDQSAPEGAGLDLALVKKTVDLVGGRIEVVSDPKRGRGTTFHVSWPKKIEV